MNEQIQSPREHSTGSGPWDSIFDEPENVAGHVMVRSGPHSETLPLTNLTIGEIRARFHDVLDIDEQARAVLDGQDVNNDTVVRQGQVLMFTHRAGEKGFSALPSRLLDLTLATAFASTPTHQTKSEHRILEIRSVVTFASTISVFEFRVSFGIRISGIGFLRLPRSRSSLAARAPELDPPIRHDRRAAPP